MTDSRESTDSRRSLRSYVRYAQRIAIILTVGGFIAAFVLRDAVNSPIGNLVAICLIVGVVGGAATVVVTLILNVFEVRRKLAQGSRETEESTERLRDSR